MSVTEALLGRPHLLVDSEGRTLSCACLEEVASREFISIEGAGEKTIGQIKCLDKDVEAFQYRFKEDTSEFASIRVLWKSKREEILHRDLESLLLLSNQSSSTLDEVLYKCCLFIRAHLLVENVSIFGIPDGSSLAGLVAVTADGSKNRESHWDYSAMNIGGIAITQKIPYICADTEADKNFQKGGQESATRNLVSLPILHRGEAIGLLNVSNQIANQYTPEAISILLRFSNLIAHLLREDFERQKSEKFLNTSANLGRYLSTNLVRKIAQTGTSGSLGGELKRTVVLFSDIRSFTTISEGLAPSVLVQLLNFYFEEMSTIISKYNGTLDKLVGDLMMVLWNVPTDQPEPEVLALKAALEMQRVTKQKVAPRWLDSGVKNFGIGIGINAGPAVAGNLGSSHFMNYTVIGNTINTAQRLEAHAKAGEIWVHQDLLPLVEGKVPLPVRKESNLKLKGLIDPISAFVFTAS